MAESLALILEYATSVTFVRAAGITLLVTVLSMVFGVLIGLILALLQESRWPGASGFVTGYLWFFRGTPVLFQIIFVFNVLPTFGILLSGLVSGVLALALNEGAYMSEILRSGLQAVSKGQRTAGRSLGMRDWEVMRHIVIPQAMRTVIPPTGNQFIGMLKLSALISVIAVQDLLLVANQIASAKFRYLEALMAAGIYYLVMTTIFMIIQSRIERWAVRRNRYSKQTLSQRLLGMTGGTPDVR